jgi:hypothetical protein
MKPAVSVILVSYNTAKLTLKCLRHVYASKNFDLNSLEVIVVDNNSSDDTVKNITAQYPDVKIINNSSNVGFGTANNQGVKSAHSDLILLLNTDAFIAQDTLTYLVNELLAHTEYLAIGPKYLYPDNAPQQSAGYFPTLRRVLGWMLALDKVPLLNMFFSDAYHLSDYRWYRHSHAVDWVMGACVLFRRDEFLSIGGFDEKIFMYGEEVDLFMRLSKKFSKSAFYTCEASIIHLGSASTKIARSSRLVQEFMGIEYIYTKYFKQQLWIIRLLIYTGVILRLLFFTLTGSHPEAVLEYKKFLKK